MRNTSLGEKYLILIRNLRADTGMYRALALFSAVSLPLFRVILPQDAYDPFVVRAALGAAILTIFLASLFVKFVNHNIAHFGHVVIYALCAWGCWLAWENDYSNPYLINLFVVHLFASINFKTLRSWLVFSVLLLATALIACFAVSIEGVSLWPYLGLLAFNILVSAVVISFRTTIQNELNLQRDLVASIFESNPDAILMANASTLEVYDSNQHASVLFGLGKSGDRKLLHRHLTAWLTSILGQEKGTTRLGRRQSALLTLQNQTLWGEIVITEIQTRGAPQLLISISDITEKKTFADRLQLSDDILQKVDHLVLVSDKDANIVYTTPSVQKILGFMPQEVLGQGWWELKRKNGIDPSDDIAYVKRLATGDLTEERAEYEGRHIDGSGKEQWILWKDSITASGLVMSVGMLHTQARRDALIRSVIFNIAEGSSKAQNPGEFYQFIHYEIRRIIDTPNFYIAVYDADDDAVTFPYYSDAADSNYLNRTSRKRKAGQGLTEYGIKRRKPLLISRDDIEQLNERGMVNLSGQAIPEVWLGVPMIHDDEVVGLITVQNYERANAYSQDDLALVSFIASQVAQFVAKLQSDEALRVSEVRFRSIYNQAAVGIAQLTPEGEYLQVNHKLEEIFGYSMEELSNMSPRDFTHPDDVDLGMEELEELMDGKRESYSKEKRYRHKNGSNVSALLHVSAYREGGVPVFIISVYEDITEKKRAQEETELLLRLGAGLNAAENTNEAVMITLRELAGFEDWGFAEAYWLDGSGKHQPGSQMVVRDEALRALASQSHFDPSLIEPERLSHKLIWLSAQDDAFQFPKYDALRQQGVKTLVQFVIYEDNQVVVLLCLMTTQTNMHRESLEKIAGAVRSQLMTVISRKHAEAARIESENRYRAITQAAFEGIAIYQGECILDCNAAFARIFEYEQDTVLGMSLTDLIYDESPTEIVEQITKGEKSGVEFIGRKQGGGAIFLEALSRADTWQGEEARILAIRDITSQKLMEEAREAARIDARFKVYIQNSSEIIKIHDAEGRINYCSPSFSRIFGISSDSMLGKQQLSLVHPGDQALYLDKLAEVLKTPLSTVQMQLRVPHPSGETRIFQTSLTNLLEDPMVKGVLVSEADITTVIEAQQSMRESEARFKLLFERSPDAIFVESEEGHILDVNEAACNLHEMSREELLSKTVIDLVPEENREAVLETFPSLLEHGISYFEGESLTKSGKVVEVEIRSSTVHYQNQRSLLLLVRDITERKKTENALRDSERKNKALLDGVPDLIVRITAAGHILDFKQSDQSDLIKFYENAIGSPIQQLLPQNMAEKLLKTAELTLSEGLSQQFESEVVIAGETKDYESRIVRSGPNEVLVIIRNVTDRKRTEKELIKRNFELDSFVYRASHDLKAPLNSLMGLISLIETETQEAGVLAYIRMMNKSVVKLDSFIRDLADFSRNARLELEQKPIDWQAMLNDTIENLQFADNADRITKNITINVDQPFYSDAVRIGIIFNNLISNAIKYQNLQRKDARVDVTIQTIDDGITIEIADNGIGIAKEHQAKVYNLFFRASIQSYGSGMGMYIVKNAIDKLKGTILLDSEEGVGTKYKIHLPNLGELQSSEVANVQ
jgi:PAS domain S-box-containing protein